MNVLNKNDSGLFTGRKISLPGNGDVPISKKAPSQRLKKSASAMEAVVKNRILKKTKLL